MLDVPTTNPRLNMAHATPQDAPLVLAFLVKLMTYQKMPDEVTATPDRIARLLRDGHAEAVFAKWDGVPVGLLFFSPTSSAYTGRTGLFIDCFYVDQGLRGQGIGKAMMAYLSQLSLDRGGEMLEWGCLDWNQPTIDFYESLGAYCLDTMRIYRLPPDRLAALEKQV